MLTTLEGKEEFISNMNDLKVDIQEQVIKQFNESGLDIRNKLRDSLPEAGDYKKEASTPGNVPFSHMGESKKGRYNEHLKEEIKYGIPKLMLGEAISLKFYVNSRAFWGHMLEFGTSKMEPRPFFFTGLARLVPEMKNSLVDLLKGTIANREQIIKKNKKFGPAKRAARSERDLAKLRDFIGD